MTDDTVRVPKREQEPVAWRYRYGKTGMWKYADTAEECNVGKEYEREPLYGFPWDFSAAPSTDAPAVDYLKLARRIWRDLRHALNDLSVGRSAMLADQKARLEEFAKYLGDTSDYRQNLPPAPAAERRGE